VPNRTRTCTVCGTKVELPKKRDENGSGEVKCPSCGAKAPLRFKMRNGNVKGLKGCFAGTRFT